VLKHIFWIIQHTLLLLDEVPPGAELPDGDNSIGVGAARRAAPAAEAAP
jgi:hypothetical protein